MLLTLRHTAIAVFSALVMVASITTPAAASPLFAPVEGLEERTPAHIRGSADMALDRLGLPESAENPNVRLPKSGTGSLVFDSAAGAPSWMLSLPMGLDRAPAISNTSSALFRSSDGTFDVIAEEVNTTNIRGVDARILLVIGGPQAPTRFEFHATLPEGASLVPHFAGGVEVVDASGEAIAYIEPPWAIDANGTAVATRFEVRGDTLIQIIDHKGAVYPVVADPSVQGDCGWVTCTVRFDRTLTQFIGWTGMSLAGLAAAACSGLGGAVGAACGVAILAIGWLVTSRTRNYYNNGNCLGIKFYLGGVPAWTHQVTRNTYNCG